MSAKIGPGSIGKKVYREGSIRIIMQQPSDNEPTEINAIFSLGGRLRAIQIERLGREGEIYILNSDRNYGNFLARKNNYLRSNRRFLSKEDLQDMLDQILHDYLALRMNEKLVRK